MHPEEFGKLVTAYKNRLFRLACSMLHDPAGAEDLVQDVFLKLWKMKSELNNYKSVEALIIAITRNLCLNKIKARRSMISDNMLERSASHAVLPDVQVEQKEKIEQDALLERIRCEEHSNTRTCFISIIISYGFREQAVCCHCDSATCGAGKDCAR